jgi:hypothetical protein
MFLLFFSSFLSEAQVHRHTGGTVELRFDRRLTIASPAFEPVACNGLDAASQPPNSCPPVPCQVWEENYRRK